TDFIPTPSARHDELMVANQSIRGVKIGRRFPGLWGQFCTPIHIQQPPHQLKTSVGDVLAAAGEEGLEPVASKMQSVSWSYPHIVRGSETNGND
ncbi:hypothetical protein B5V01_26000, partial [Mesorhizobium erdmanii]